MYKDIGLWRETYQEAPAAPAMCVWRVCACVCYFKLECALCCNIFYTCGTINTLLGPFF